MLKYIILLLTLTTVFSTLPLTCPDGEYLDSTNTPPNCKPCQLHCATCTSSTNCLTCQSRYFFYTTDNTCELQTLIQTSNCIDINEKSANPTICKTCEDNYWLASNKSCIEAKLGYCLTFTQDKAVEECETVKQGYSKSGNSVLNCSKIHLKCLSCSSEASNGCTACNEGYFKTNSGSCSQKTKNCKTWADLDTEECSACETGYSIHPIDKSCYATQCLNNYCGNSKARSSSPNCNSNCHSNDPKCIDCSTTEEHTCLQCSEGYQLFEKQCFNASAVVSNCKTLDSATTCGTCKDSYTLLNEGALCQVNIAGCETMENAENCTTCSTGYYLIAETKQCAKCKDNCTCIEATTGETGEKCANCQSKYWKNTDSCDPCTDLHCLTCSAGVSLCTVCESGWTNYNNACVKNIDNCDEMLDTANCKDCATGYIKNDANKCFKSDNCNSMTNLTHCGSCVEGYWVNSTSGNCMKCLADNCKTCQAGGKSCQACKDGYNLDTTKNIVDAICVQCTVTNAKYVYLDCASENKRIEFPWKCAALKNNCIENNLTPDIGEAEQNCKTCTTGYRIKDDNTCESCTDTNCHACLTAKATCTECKFGYYLKDNVCTVCDTTCSNCVTDVANNGTCIDCQDKYAYLLAPGEDKKKCTKCIDNCQRCSVNNACIQCSSGYYLKDDSTSCLACSKNCTDCDINTVCFACSEGSYLNDTKCQSCLDSCKICVNGSNCKECLAGYQASADKTKCVKQNFTGRECMTITDCVKCSVLDSSKCSQCKSGSAPVEDKCSCDTGKLLIGGKCVEQSDKFPDDLSEKTLTDLSGLVTVALSSSSTKAKNAKDVLVQVKNILSAENGNTNANAGTALQLLMQLSDAATEVTAEDSYKSILTTSCAISDLDQTNFEIAFAAADKFMTTASDSKAIYNLGFSTCLTNLLKKDTIEDISPMVLTNSEFTLRKFSTADGEKLIELTGITVTANEDFMTAVGDGEYYATVQAIKNSANPFKNETTNNVTLSSKIVSFSVMSSGSEAGKKTITLNSNKIFPITFDAAADSAKCGYYNMDKKQWVQDGAINQKEKRCSFSHLTDFAIFTVEESNSTETSAYNLQAVIFLLLIIAALF